MERVEVAVETAEDRWAVRALDAHVGLEQLRGEGMTRELPVFGWLLPDGDAARDASFAVGIVDELWLDRSRPASRARLVDHATRASRALPTEAQARTTRVQLMAYKTLFDGLVRRGADCWAGFSSFSRCMKIGLQTGMNWRTPSRQIASARRDLLQNTPGARCRPRPKTSSTKNDVFGQLALVRALKSDVAVPRRRCSWTHEWPPAGNRSGPSREKRREMVHGASEDARLVLGRLEGRGLRVDGGTPRRARGRGRRGVEVRAVSLFGGLSHRGRLRRAVGAREEGEKGDRRGRVSSGRRASRQAGRSATREPTAGGRSRYVI